MFLFQQSLSQWLRCPKRWQLSRVRSTMKLFIKRMGFGIHFLLIIEGHSFYWIINCIVMCYCGYSLFHCNNLCCWVLLCVSYSVVVVSIALPQRPRSGRNGARVMWNFWKVKKLEWFDLCCDRRKPTNFAWIISVIAMIMYYIKLSYFCDTCVTSRVIIFHFQ